MGKIFKSGSSSQTSTNRNEPWAPTTDSLKNIIKGADQAYTKQQQNGYVSPTGDLSPIYANYQQQQAAQAGDTKTQTQGLINQGQANFNQNQAFYDNQAQGGMNLTPQQILEGGNQFMNSDLLQQQIDAATHGVIRDLNENQLPNINRNAAATGNMGSSRTGIAEGVVTRGAEETARNISAQMRGQAYQDGLNRATDLATGNRQTQMLGNQGVNNLAGQQIGLAGSMPALQAGANSPYLDQAKLAAMLQAQGQADKIGANNFDYENLSKYLSLIAPIASAGGTSTSTASGGGGNGSIFNQALGAGQGIASIWSAFSDIRLKKNIETIGHANGIRYVSWEWNKKANDLGLFGESSGVIAQELQQKYPELVHADPNGSGYLKVNYSGIPQAATLTKENM